MNGPLIHTRQGRLPRLVDAAVTLVAWAGFLFLFYRGVAAMVQVPSLDLTARFDALRSTVDTLLWYGVIAAFNAAVLAGWALYNQIRRKVERRSVIPALDDSQLSASFHLTPELLQAMRSNQVIVVHNDEHGGIADVMPRCVPGAWTSSATEQTMGATAVEANRIPWRQTA
ncbi:MULTISPECIES: poly-beta-1,6-N-acetyl-D-glucosamine biosynthesis protein PgaD [unclassified Acidovorax]|uniref:poly-beta-1,6-N-acetyl-D-glucosamine biosynthesis protein PgaD n=1 Tax=unclassified Acidovorax TaxID=2684926 RepID=UPI0037C8764C